MSIRQNIHSPCQPVTKSSIHRFVYLSCHLFTMSYIDHHGPCLTFLSSICPVSQLPWLSFTMSSIHHAIQSWLYPVTLLLIHNYHGIHSPSQGSYPKKKSSIHHVIQSPCHQFTMSSSPDHGPCHPFTMSSIHCLSQSPCHSGPISSYHPQVMRPEELNQKVFLVLLETTVARGASSFFSCAIFSSCSHPPTLPHSTANKHLPYSWSSYDLFVRPLN